MALNFRTDNLVVRSNSSALMNLIYLLNNILEVLVSDYSLISEFVLEVFGFDISLMISVCALVFEFVIVINYCYRYIQELMLNYFTVFITVDFYDDIHAQIIL